jgi:hypothetical protein
MTPAVFGFCAIMVVSLTPHVLRAQVTEQTSDFSFRPQGGGYAVIGSGGVQGLRIGGKVNTTNRTSIELSIGTVPFLELSGLKARIYGTAYNYYIRGDHVATGFFSFVAAYAVVTTTSDEYEGNLLLFGPTLGVDYSPERQWSLFLRMGFAGGFSSAGKPKTTFTMDLGAGWRMW